MITIYIVQKAGTGEFVAAFERQEDAKESLNTTTSKLSVDEANEVKEGYAVVPVALLDRPDHL